ncbi:AGAP013426-PA-like protein [Anopheles sinensis]|uniref:AGAP013426-PA-like protein n=1 Tax=Anopheles sinensis TaxID=74873 RepID=A0A084VGA5_ANOSI|nr:AGAP013426-PA-like protein [Anopheles sinensis]
MFMSITAIMNAGRVSEIIGRDNCTTDPDAAEPAPICNHITFAFLLLASGLDCFMSLVLSVGIMLRKTLLLKLYMVHMWCHMSFCFYCWLAILMAFRGALASSTLLSVWGVVLILASVYFAMEVWITRGGYEAVRQERAKLERETTAGAGDVLLSLGGFIS